MHSFPGRFPELARFAEVTSWVPGFEPSATPGNRRFVATLRHLSGQIATILRSRLPERDVSLAFSEGAPEQATQNNDEGGEEGDQEEDELQDDEEVEEERPRLIATIKKPGVVLNNPAVRSYPLFTPLRSNHRPSVIVAWSPRIEFVIGCRTSLRIIGVACAPKIERDVSSVKRPPSIANPKSKTSRLPLNDLDLPLRLLLPPL